MIAITRRFFAVLETRDRNPLVLLTIAVVVGALRGQFESLFFSLDFRNSDLLAYIPFYFSLAFIYATVLRMIPGANPRRIFNAAFIATSLGILPPILDLILNSAKTHNIFYGYYFIHDLVHFPWFGYSPGYNYPLGECIVIWLSVALCGVYALFSSGRLFGFFFGCIVGYSIYLLYALIIPWLVSYFLYGYLPNIEAYSQLPHAEKRLVLYYISIVQLFVGAFLFLMAKKRTFLLIVSRIPHYLPFYGALLWGASFGVSDGFMLTGACLTLGLLSVSATFMNEYFDAHSPQSSRVTRVDMELLNLALFQILLMYFFCGYRFVIPIFANLVLCIYYHYPFGNGRKHYLTAMKIEGLWGLFCFLAGYATLRPETSVGPKAHLYISLILCFGGFSLISIMKDAKDVIVDKVSGRKTLFVMLTAQGIEVKQILARFSWYIGALYAGVLLIFAPLFLVNLPILGAAILSITAIVFSSRYCEKSSVFKIFLSANFLFMVCMAMILH